MCGVTKHQIIIALCPIQKAWEVQMVTVYEQGNQKLFRMAFPYGKQTL